MMPNATGPVKTDTPATTAGRYRQSLMKALLSRSASMSMIPAPLRAAPGWKAPPGWSAPVQNRSPATTIVARQLTPRRRSSRHRSQLRPTRLSHEELTRRAREHRGDRDVDTANDVTHMLPPIRISSGTSQAKVSSPDSMTVSSSEKTQASCAQRAIRRMLASARRLATMKPTVDADLPLPADVKRSRTPMSAQRERASPSWLRRPTASLISILKAVNIP